jgi:hypothetical protein
MSRSFAAFVAAENKAMETFATRVAAEKRSPRRHRIITQRDHAIGRKRMRASLILLAFIPALTVFFPLTRA